MKRVNLFVFLSVFLSLTLVSGTTYAKGMKIEYPETSKIAVQDTLHGVVIVDNYR
ncbi:hypothetical protein KAW18_07690 [candidate division WOR-3 bacterium]|nr:hypothetical protein [candidate division WOR-3 bacterium]